MKNTLKIAVVAVSLLVTACSGASIATEAGHGEFRNKDGTQRKEITVKANVSDNVHIIAKTESLTSNNGKVDDSKYSLISGDDIYFGAGFHTKSKTPERSEMSALFGKDFYKLSLQNKRRIWGRLGLISGISYVNAYKAKRSTTEARIGAYWLAKNIIYTYTYTVGNDTREAVNDYVLFGVEKYF